MLNRPKIDKLNFTINKRELFNVDIDRVISYLKGKKGVEYNNNPPNYIIVNLNPNKLIRQNINYDATYEHNLQMNTDLILNFFNELEKFHIYPYKCNITNLHIAKDRIMEEIPKAYNKPLIDNQTQYKGRIVAYEENNGTTPRVRVCNKSKSMKRGSWLIKFYDKAVEIQEHLKITEINPLEPLSKEDIKLLGRGYSRYTGRINLTKINLMRCEVELKNDSLLLLPHIGTRLTAMDIITMIKGEVLYNELNKVFEEILNKGVFPTKKEPTKTSLLDDFLVSGSMSRFDRLFQALGRYQTYKEYSNSVISEKDKLLNEIYDKFVMC